LDLSEGKFEIYFDQMLNVSTFKPSRVSVIGQKSNSYPYDTAAYVTGYKEVSFMDRETVLANRNRVNFTFISFYLTSDDYAALKYNPTVANDIADSFLVLRQGAVSSLVGARPSKEINQSVALQASILKPDTVLPSLVAGAFNYTSGYVTLVFSEPIGVPPPGSMLATGEVTMTGLAMQSAEKCAFVGTGSGCKGYVEFYQTPDVRLISVSNYSRTVVYYIGMENLNNLRLATSVATRLSTTFLSVYASIANDTSGNPMGLVTRGNRDEGIAVSSYVPDLVPPVLLSWKFDAAAVAVSLLFNKPIDPDYFNYSAMVIISSPTGFSSTGATPTTVIIRNVDTDILNPQLTESQTLIIQYSPSKALEIQSNPTILTGSGNSYLILYPDAVSDNAVNHNMYRGTGVATASQPLQVGTFSEDSIPPQLLQATMNMTGRTFTLTFTKPMYIPSVTLTEISLQSLGTSLNSELLSLSSRGPTAVTLLTQSNSKVLVFKLSKAAFANIMLQATLCHSLATCYLFFSSKFATDSSRLKNKVVEIKSSAAYAFDYYVPNYAKPLLTSWYANEGYDRLYLTFDQPMDVTSRALDLTSITLHDDSIVNAASQSVTLGTGSVVYGVNVSSIYVQLSAADASLIKTKPPLCTTRDRCFLSHTATLARNIATYDGNGTKIQNYVPAEKFVQSSASFVVDVVPPTLTSYTVNMDFFGFGDLELTFSEPVRSQYLVPTGISLFSAASQSAVSVQLSVSSFSPDTNAYLVNVLLSSYDYIRMKMAGIGSSGLPSSFFMQIQPPTVSDIAENQIKGFTNGASFLSPVNLFTDDLPPAVNALTLDSTKSNLTIYFNDAVDVTTLQLGHVVLYSLVSGSKLSLTGAQIMTKSSSAAVVFRLTPIATSISKSSLLATQDDSFLYLDRAGTVVDVPMKNQNALMTASKAIRVGQRFLTFRMDLAKGIFYIDTAYQFDTSSTWDPTQIGLLSLTSGNKVPFSNSDVFRKFSEDMIQITVQTSTLNAFKAAMTFTNKDSIAMVFTPTAFVDSSGRQLSGNQQINCVQLIPDTIPPALQSFTLDLGLGTITLVLSKVVLIPLANLGFISLQSAPTMGGDAINIPLSGTSITTSTDSPSFVITISLNRGGYPTIRDQLNLGSQIGTSVQNTYIVIGKNFIGDTIIPPNFMAPVVQQATKVVQDIIKPTLSSWSIDFTSKQLLVTYSEAINPATNVVSGYLLLQNPATSTNYERFLSTTTTDTTVVGNTVKMLLSVDDINAIYAMTPNLCTRGGPTTAGGNCFLAIRQNSIQDVKGNTMAAVVHVFATLPPSIFVPDMAPPSLLNFTTNMELGTIDFSFDKVLDCKSMNLNNLILQFSSFLGNCRDCEYYSMTSSAPVCGTTIQPRYSAQVHVDINLPDLLAIKAFSKLFKSDTYSYVRPQTNFVQSTWGVSIASLQDGNAIRVASYSRNTIPPQLISFTITSSKNLYLYFTEPVLVSSVDVTKITFYDDFWPTTRKYFSLTSASYVSSTLNYGMTLVISLGADYASISSSSRIFNYQQNTLMAVTSAFVTDTSGNKVVAIKNTTALQYGPSVVSWDLDLMTGAIVLTFPEAMKGNFTPAGLTIQPVMKALTDGSTPSVALTSPTRFNGTESTGTTFIVKLTTYDLNLIKFYRVAAAKTSTYLTVPFGLTKSVYVGTLLPNLDVVARSNQRGLAVRFFTPDTMPPLILSWHLNLNLGKLYILFNEPVLASTFVVQSITVVNDAGSFATLSSPSAVGITVRNLTEAVISLCRFDLNAVKAATKVGILTRMVVLPYAMTDVAGNSYAGNTQNNPIFATTSVPDTLPSRLLNATLDMTAGVMTLQFDEIVNISSINPSNVYIGSSKNFASATKFQLTKFSPITEDDEGLVTVDLKTYETDYNNLKAISSVGTKVSNTFVYIVGIKDIFGNTMTTQTYKQAVSVIPDLNPLELVAFNFLILAGGVNSFTLFFNRNVLLSSFDCSDFVLTSALAPSSANVSFVKSGCVARSSASSSRIIVFNSTATIPNSFADANTCFMYVPVTGKTKDNTIGSRLVASTPLTALQMGVQLTNALVDLNVGVVTLIFSASVKLTTFNPFALGFYSAVSGQSFFLQSTILSALSPTPFSSQTSTINNNGMFKLSSSDLNLLKTLDIQNGKLFAITQVVTSGSSTSSLITDPRGIRCAVASITPVRDASVAVSKIVRDTIIPNIVKITFYAGTSKVTIQFDEPMRSSSFVVSNFVFQSSATSAATSYRLSSASAASTGVLTNLTLSTRDSEGIKLTKDLLKSASTSYLSFAYRTAADYGGNYLPTVPATAARFIDEYIPDTIKPTLVSFALDMTTTVLTLSMSEPVLMSKVNVTQITLQSRIYSADGAFYTLTGGTVLGQDSSTVSILLTAKDVYNIKNTKGLCRAASSTYIVISSDASTDIAGNSVVPVIDRQAQLVSSYTVDSVSPTVTSISIDLDAKKVFVNFSELVQLLLVSTNGLIFYSSSQIFGNTTTSYALTSESTVEFSSLYSTVVQVNLGQRDFDTIKYRRPLVQSKAQTYFAVTSAFAADTSFNPNVAVTVPIKAAKYIRKISLPRLLTYKLDMSSGVVSLQFNESMSASSLAMSQFIVQSNRLRRYGKSVALTDSSTTTTIDWHTAYLSMSFSQTTFNTMKFNGIGKSTGESLLSWSDRAIQDQFRNYLPPQWDGSILGFEPLVPTTIMLDVLSPNLLRWQLDRTAMALVMYFDEPVVLQNTSAISIITSLGGGPQIITPAVKAVVNGTLNTIISISLKNFCAWPAINTCGAKDSVKTFFRTVKETAGVKLFLAVTPEAFVDYAAVPNPVNPFVPASPLQEGAPGKFRIMHLYYLYFPPVQSLLTFPLFPLLLQQIAHPALLDNMPHGCARPRLTACAPTASPAPRAPF